MTRVQVHNMTGLYLHVVHDELEEASQGAAFLLYPRIHFSTGSGKKRKTFHSAQKKSKTQTLAGEFSTSPAEEASVCLNERGRGEKPSGEVHLLKKNATDK